MLARAAREVRTAKNIKFYTARGEARDDVLFT